MKKSSVALVFLSVLLTLSMMAGFPSECYAQQRVIQFAGCSWIVKSGYSDPGGNYWSDDEESVWVDNNGMLHLKLREVNGTWYCAEVVSEGTTRYGMHRFHMITKDTEAQLDDINENVVVGLFLYKDNEHEIDIEFTSNKDFHGSDQQNGPNALYAVQPSDVLGNAEPFQMEINGTYTTHYINWDPSRIDFKSIHGHYPEPPSPDYLIHEWPYTGSYIPQEEDNLHIHINLWLYDHQPPSDQKEVEIIIADVDYPLRNTSVEPGWPAGKSNVPKHPWDGFMDFEEGIDEAIISSTIPGMEFTTTYGIDWRYGDIRTGKYNVYPYGHQGYETNGNCFAWLGVTGDAGRIDFTEGTATYLSVLVSTSSGVKLDAYDANDNFLATSGWAESNINTRTFTRLTVEAPEMAYVMIHDTGNYWLIDDLCTDAPGVPSPHYEAAELARSVVGAPYLWGGKGWDFSNGEFAESETISQIGYTYWNPTIGALDFGTGSDCSGLILWAYNKAYNADKFLGEGNPVTYEGADGQYRNNFEVDVAEDELLPGDVLFFDWEGDGYMDHVAMYVGPNGDGTDVIHASSEIEWAKKDELKELAGFVGFRRLTEPTAEMEFGSHSPIDLVVTDPDGVIITKDTYEVPGVFYYSEWDIDGDGELDDMVIVPERKIGDYLITVVPEPDASPTDTYTLWVSLGGINIVLAANVQVADIPAEGYIVRSTETIIMQIIPATIDFDPDILNLKSKGKYVTAYIELPVGYDVSQIDISSIALNSTVPAFAKPTEVGDHDGDGIPDLMVKFDRTAVQGLLTSGSQVEITITGQVAGIVFEGSDNIRVIDLLTFPTYLPV